MHTLVRRLTFALLPLAAVADRAVAQVYNGPGLYGGVEHAAGISGPSHMTLRGAVLNILYKVLNYLALIAVAVIIFAGFYLVVSQGSDDVKEKVKKIILYVAIGLLIVFFARLFVGFITNMIFYVG